MTARVTPLCSVLAASCLMLASLPAVAQGPPLLREAFSREFSIHIGGEQTPLVKEFFSREVSFFIGAEPASPYAQAISREMSLLVTTPAAPARVTQLTVSVSPTGDSALLNWSGYNEVLQSDVVRYRIYVATTPFITVTNLTPFAIVPAGTLSLAITNLTPWQDHYFAVVAEDALVGSDPGVSYSAAYVLAPQAISRELSLFVGGEPTQPNAQAISRELSLLITTPTPPERIAQLAITVSPTGERATLDWSAYNELLQRDVLRYDIFITTSPFTTVAGLTRFTNVPAGTFSFTVSNLTAWQDHYFAVVPIDALGGYEPVVDYSAAYVLAPQAISRELSLFVGGEAASPYSQAISREVAILVPDAAVPQPVTCTNCPFIADTSKSAFSAIDLDWSTYNEVGQRDVMRYRIYLGPSFFTDVTGLTPYTNLPAGTFRPTVLGLHGGSIYYVAVVAEDAIGGFNSTVFSRSVQASIGALGEVLNLAVTSSSNSLHFTWSAPEQVDAFLSRYHVYLGDATDAVVLSPGSTHYDVASLLSATAYAFRISTVDTFNTESAGVPLLTATWLNHPTNLVAQPFDGMVRLTWTHAEPNDLAKHYAVYRSTTPFNTVAGLPPFVTTRETRTDIGGLANGTSYYFAVTTVNLVDGENPAVQALTATPNPVSGTFADLAISNIVVADSVDRGQTTTIGWSVSNVGTGATSTGDGTPVNSWFDRVGLSPDNVIGDGDDILLAEVPHTTSLAAGGIYSGSATVQIPTNLLGNYHLFVMANASGQVYEHLDLATNLGGPRILTIGPSVPPFITQQPADQMVAEGSPVSFSVTAEGSPPFTYQWRHDGVPVPGATNAVFALLSAQLSDAGSYSVIVANIAGATNSRIATLAVGRLPIVITNATTITDINTNYEGGSIIVDGATLTVFGMHTFQSLTVRNGGLVTHQQGNLGGLRLHVLGNLTVETNAAIAADGRGYGQESGPGGGVGGFAAASYGGTGGGGPATYGSATEPVDLGSGSAGPGGGAVRLTVDGILRVDGRIGANAGNASAASGGSVYLVAGHLTGMGRVTADGSDYYNNIYRGGGGGGRIALYWQTNSYAGSLTACGGSSGGNGGGGGAGTIFSQAPGARGQVVVNNCGKNAGFCGLSGTNAVEFSNMDVLVESGTLSVDSQQVFGSLTVRNGGLVTHQQGNLGGLRLRVLGNLTVETNTAIAADGRGYGQESGPGGGVGGFAAASYGGTGGGGPATYGSATEPVDLGSGSAGPGGGAIRLTVDGVLRVDGRIGANAGYASAGSGGSVYLVAGQLTGAGSITADGSDYFNNIYRGGGGGGRIALYWQSNNFAGIIHARGGASSGVGGPGANGTVYLQEIMIPRPDLAGVTLTAPSDATAGQPVSVSWTVVNAGSLTADAPWREMLLLANNSAGSNASPLFTLTVGASLAASNTVTRTQTVILPGGLSGNFWLAVRLDTAGQIAEGNGETNNLFVGTQPILLTSPDLEVNQIASSAMAVFGQPFAVSWQVTNAGTGAALGNWRDRVWLSPSSNSLAGAISLTVAANVSSLPSLGRYTNSAMLNVPLTSQSAPGGYWIIVSADESGAVAESNEGNNLLSVPLALTLPPLPDLIAADLTSPAFTSPGEAVPVSWAVTNIGPTNVNGVWRESVYLLPDAGLDRTNVQSRIASAGALVRSTFTNSLAPGGFITRTESVVVPFDSDTGNLRFVVLVDSANDLVEGNETNNIALATNAVVVPAVLTLNVPASLVEGSSAQGSVTRNGSRAATLTVMVTNSDPSEISFDPSILTSSATVTIPAGQSTAYFTVRALTDGIVDGSQFVTIRASSPGYPSDARIVTVQDVDVPRLTLTLLDHTVAEGMTVGATITRDLVTSNDLTVFLQSSSPNRLTVPLSVTIPGGTNSWTFAILAVDDDLISATTAYSVSASAAGFTGSSASVTILDNDFPAVTLTLAQTNVSEGAGPQATLATLTRSTVTARALTLDLESSNTNAARVPTRITIPAYQASASFPVAAVDNDLLDGPKEVLLSAYVIGTSASTRLGLAATNLLIVTDDDGPTLKLALARKLVAEGLNPATTATVTRNFVTNQPLVVHLASSDTNEATATAIVTIPADQRSVDFPIVSIADDVTDGNKNVTFTAEADGFTSGVDTFTVSDINLPDLVVSSVIAPATADTEAYVNIGYRVVNQGLAPAGTNWTTRIFLSRDSLPGDDILLGNYTFNGTIPPGLFFEQTLSLRMPQAAGDYWVVVQTDVAEQVTEVLEGNNTTVAARPIHLQPAYEAWVQADLDTALAGTPVPMHGRAYRGGTNNAAPEGSLVNIHISVRGTHRVISALADADGYFSTLWIPLPGEAGVYEIGAAHPGDATAPVQDVFRLIGMKANPASVALKVTEQSSVTGQVNLENLSDEPLTGLSATVVDKPSNLQVTTSVGNGGVLSGLGQIALGYAITANDASVPQGTVCLRVASAEGASVEVPIAVTVEPRRARLVANPTELYASMKRGGQSVVEFELVNQGGIPSGPITVSLPAAAWLSLASTNPMPSLAPGETNRVSLLLTPPTDLALGDFTGSLALNCDTASFNVPFTFRSLSEAKGDLRITAVDEYTYYAEGSPKVTNASVTITDAVTKQVVANGATDARGEFFVEALTEGYYSIEASAETHSTYRRTYLLVPGQTTDVQAFLVRQAVRYIWTVEPSEFEDHYNIAIETVFETVVPKPVVTISPSLIDLREMTEASRTVILTITNHGLLTAKAAQLWFPVDSRFDFIPLVTSLGDLPPRSSILVPVSIVKRSAVQGANATAFGNSLATPKADEPNPPATPDPCSLPFGVDYIYECGGHTIVEGALGALEFFDYYCNPFTFVPRLAEEKMNQEPQLVGAGDRAAIAPPTQYAYASAGSCAVPSAAARGSVSAGDTVKQTRGFKDNEGTVDSGVCARVRVQIDQDAVITRDAFRATLELDNVSNDTLQNIQVDVVVQDSNGQVWSDVFAIRPPQLDGLTGVDGSGALGVNSTGKATWVILPTSDAAPDGPTQFLVGGTLRYTQGGTLVTVPLSPAPITVYPNASLKVQYFHERDVFSDDPFTDIVEPSIPYSLAVIIQNKGKGAARNVRITSAQPQIIENEKGLLIDFKIIATEVAGRNMMPSLTAEFGSITNGQIAIGRWLLTSTLQGLFIDYNAKFKHTDGLGNERLSLIDEVSIHETIHLVQAPGGFEDSKPDFLVNEIPDEPLDLPDTLYLSDGSTSRVDVVTGGTVVGTLSGTSLVVTQSVTMPSGWAYLRVPDPGDGHYRLRRVVRSDGVEIYFGTNVWTTDRTFIGMGKRPIRENILHLLDYGSTGSYTLYYATPPALDTAAPQSLVVGLPPSSYERIPVSWSGSDESGGSGLAFFDVFVSDNSGPFLPWLQRSSLRSAVYQGTLGHSYAFYSRATDLSGNVETAPATAQATTFVNRTNSVPVLAALGAQTIDEGQTLVLDPPVSDIDGDSLAFSRSGNPPAGLFLNPSTGRITWTTSEVDGPSTNILTLRVEDSGFPRLAATNTVTIVVREVNTAPILAAIPAQKVKEGQLLSLALTASDFDLPAQALSYQLGPRAPSGAGVTNGVFSWRPTELQGPSTNLISVIVADSGVPSLSSTQSFSVVVVDTLPDFVLSIGSTNLFVGETNFVPVRLVSGLDLTNLSFLLDLPVSRLTGLQIEPALPNLETALTSGTSNRWAVTLSAKGGQNLQGEQTIARITFGTDTNAHSAVVPLDPGLLAGTLRSGTLLSRGAAYGGRVILVGKEPVLEPHRATPPFLTLYGHAGATYAIEFKTNLLEAVPWSRMTTLQLSGRSADTAALVISAPFVVYRAVALSESIGRLSISNSGGEIFSFRLQGDAGTQYLIQTSTNADASAPWMDILDLNLTNSWRTFDWTNRGESKRFFRAIEK